MFISDGLTQIKRNQKKSKKNATKLNIYSFDKFIYSPILKETLYK